MTSVLNPALHYGSPREILEQGGGYELNIEVDFCKEHEFQLTLRELQVHFPERIHEQESSDESLSEEKEVQTRNDTKKNEKSNSETWIRVIMKESTEVNGVRFPEGIQIDVTKQDSERLINSGKASLIK